MRILYYVNLDLQENKGVLQKLLDQVLIWQSQGCIVKIVSLSPPPPEMKETGIDFVFFYEAKKRLYGENFLRSIIGAPPEYYKELVKASVNFSPDIIYFRDIFNYYILKSFVKKFRCPVIYEANTILKTQLLAAKNGVKKILDLLYFFSFHKMLFKQLDGTVAVTPEIGREINKYISKVCVIPNGIQYREISKPKRKNVVPNVVFIGTPGLSWHGLDKIIELASLTEDKLLFHIIGYSRPQGITHGNIFFYDNLNAADYEPILLKADLAISCTALYRKKLNEAAALKVRQYLLYKIPVIVPYQETIFDKEYDFVLQLPNNETNLVSNIDKILAFANLWLNKPLEDAAIKPLISSQKIETKRLAFFKGLLTKSN